MHDLPKPDVILTHESDLDGLVAGVLLQRLAEKLFQRVIPLEAYHYHAWRQRDHRESCAWVTDLSFDARVDRPGWWVIDHHVSDATPRNARVQIDTTQSAGSLCYQLCRQQGLGSPELDRLVHLNNVADLFLEDDPEFELACDHASLVKVYQFWNLHRLLEGRIEKLLDHPLLEVMRTKRRVEDPIGVEWSRRNIVPLSPKVGFVDTVIGNTNLVVNRLLQDGVSTHPVLLTLFRRGATVMVASLRSRGGEALKVAELLKGGGHPNAAGAVLPRSVKGLPEALDYIREVLNPRVPMATDLVSLESAFMGTALGLPNNPAAQSPSKGPVAGPPG